MTAEILVRVINIIVGNFATAFITKQLFLMHEVFFKTVEIPNTADATMQSTELIDDADVLMFYSLILDIKKIIKKIIKRSE